MSYITENFHKFLPPEIGRYSNNRIAISYSIIEDEAMGPEPALTATINLPDVPLAADEVIIKDYSENEGIYRCMLKAGVIGPELRRVSSGWITAPVCKLLINPNQVSEPELSDDEKEKEKMVSDYQTGKGYLDLE